LEIGPGDGLLTEIKHIPLALFPSLFKRKIEKKASTWLNPLE